MKISVLTATYNAAEHLPRLIESLRAQTDRDFEWIVMDGGSLDNTLTQLRDAGDIVSYWESEPDFGIYHALNKAIRSANGAYYLVLGADDVLEPTAIQNYRKAAFDSGADVISAPVVVDAVVVPPLRRIALWRSSPLLVSAHSVGSLIKIQLHDELGLYSPRFPIAADVYFFLKVWKAGKKFHYINETAGTFGTDGISSNDTLGGLCESFRANVEVRGYLPIHLLLLFLRIIKNGTRIRKTLSYHRPFV